MHWDERRRAAGRVHRRRSPGCAGSTRRSAAAASSTAARCARGDGEPLRDIVWLHPDGRPMEPDDWDAGFGRSIGMFLNGHGIRGHGRPRRSGSSTTTSCSTSTPTTTADGDPAAGGVRRRRWDVGASTPAAAASTDGQRRCAGRRGPFRPRSRGTAACVPCCREHAEPRGASPTTRCAASVAASPVRRRAAPTSRAGGAGRDRAGEDDVATMRDHADAGQHLPAADHRGLRPARGGRAGCRTCTTSASTGSTSRRCWRPSRAPTTATTSSTTPRSTRAAAARTGLAGASPRRRTRPGMGVLVDIVPNHVGVADPGAERVVVGRADARPRSPRYARGVRHRLGRRRRQGPAAGARRRRRRARRAARSRTASCATTTTASRSPPGTGDGTAARGARPAALRAGRLAARPTPS